jgi:hypothetical protein
VRTSGECRDGGEIHAPNDGHRDRRAGKDAFSVCSVQRAARSTPRRSCDGLWRRRHLQVPPHTGRPVALPSQFASVCASSRRGGRDHTAASNSVLRGRRPAEHLRERRLSIQARSSDAKDHTRPASVGSGWKRLPTWH